MAFQCRSLRFNTSEPCYAGDSLNISLQCHLLSIRQHCHSYCIHSYVSCIPNFSIHITIHILASMISTPRLLQADSRHMTLKTHLYLIFLITYTTFSYMSIRNTPVCTGTSSTVHASCSRFLHLPLVPAINALC